MVPTSEKSCLSLTRTGSLKRVGNNPALLIQIYEFLLKVKVYSLVVTPSGAIILIFMTEPLETATLLLERYATSLPSMAIDLTFVDMDVGMTVTLSELAGTMTL